MSGQQSEQYNQFSRFIDIWTKVGFGEYLESIKFYDNSVIKCENKCDNEQEVCDNVQEVCVDVQEVRDNEHYDRIVLIKSNFLKIYATAEYHQYLSKTNLEFFRRLRIHFVHSKIRSIHTPTDEERKFTSELCEMITELTHLVEPTIVGNKAVFLQL